MNYLLFLLLVIRPHLLRLRSCHSEKVAEYGMCPGKGPLIH